MIRLRGESADVVIDTASGVPTIVYWGAPLGDVDVSTLTAALARPVVFGALDVVAPISVVPEHAAGFAGRVCWHIAVVARLGRRDSWPPVWRPSPTGWW